MHAFPAIKVKLADLSSMSGNTIWLLHGCLTFKAKLASNAVPPALWDIWMLHHKTLAWRCASCMHALTANLYQHSKGSDLSSMSGNSTWLFPLLLDLVKQDLDTTYAACMHALTANLCQHSCDACSTCHDGHVVCEQCYMLSTVTSWRFDTASPLFPNYLIKDHPFASLAKTNVCEESFQMEL